MNPPDIVIRAHRWLVCLSVTGDRLLVDQYGSEPSAEFLDLLREHKPALLDWLQWEQDADQLIRAVYSRLAAVYSVGCSLDDEGYVARERAVDDAYTRHERTALMAALLELERYGRQHFDRQRRT